MNAWFEALRGLDESMVRQQLAENPVSIEIAEVYSQALAVKDTVIAVAAQDELLKRGDFDCVSERFMEACRTVGIELGTDFADRIAQSLMMTDCDPLPKRLGKQLLNDPESNDAEDETKEAIRRYGKYIELSPANA